MTVEKMEIGHGEVVHDIKIDYYGQRLATASSDNTVKIIGLSSNAALKPLATLPGHQGPVLQVAWAHPKFGSILASCSHEGRVIIWKEVSQNQWAQARVFHEHKSPVNTISWAPHELGLCLACGSSDGSISVLLARSDGGWDTSRIEQAHCGGVTSVLWVPAVVPGAMFGSWLLDPLLKLASGGCDNILRVWKLYNGTWQMECAPAAVKVHSDSLRVQRDVASAPSVAPPKSTIARPPHDDVISGGPNVELLKSTIASPPQDDVSSGAPNVEPPKSTIASPPPDDVGLGAPNVELPKSTIAGPPQDNVGSGAPIVELPKSTIAGPPQDDVSSGAPIVELPKPTIASLPQDDVGSGEFKRNRWYTEEDELLVRAWLHISKGTAEGNEQKGSLWKQITKYYEDHRKVGVMRTFNQLKTRWTKINRGVKKFVECFDQASQECEGMTDETQIIAGAHKLYRSQNDDRRFLLEHAWILLKDEPKWKAHINMVNEEGCSKRMRVSESGVCMSSSNPDTLTSGDIGSSEVHDIRPTKKPTKSNGNLKDEGKSQKALTEELQGIKSAELKKAVAMEELARTKQMEIDMQIIYKDTSSMNEDQLQFHVQLVQRLKQKYLL